MVFCHTTQSGFKYIGQPLLFKKNSCEETYFDGIIYDVCELTQNIFCCRYAGQARIICNCKPELEFIGPACDIPLSVANSSRKFTSCFFF